MKVVLVFMTMGVILLGFQNCGDNLTRDTLSMAEEALTPQQCSEGNCATSANQLWMTIREFDPYKIEYSTLNNGGHFNVGGICGVGQFRHHSFLFEMREGFGAQKVVAQGFVDDRCESGRFVVPILINKEPVVPDRMYTLSLELVGLTDTNQQVSNPMPSNLGSLNVIFTFEPPN